MSSSVGCQFELTHYNSSAHIIIHTFACKQKAFKISFFRTYGQCGWGFHCMTFIGLFYDAASISESRLLWYAGCWIIFWKRFGRVRPRALHLAERCRYTFSNIMQWTSKYTILYIHTYHYLHFAEVIPHIKLNTLYATWEITATLDTNVVRVISTTFYAI
jgi:hypothetical protein